MDRSPTLVVRVFSFRAGSRLPPRGLLEWLFRPLGNLRSLFLIDSIEVATIVLENNSTTTFYLFSRIPNEEGLRVVLLISAIFWITHN